MFLWDSVFKFKPIGYKEPDNFFKPYIPIQPNLRCSFELDLITVFVPIFKKEGSTVVDKKKITANYGYFFDAVSITILFFKSCRVSLYNCHL
jgi:hypothetical protein